MAGPPVDSFRALCILGSTGSIGTQALEIVRLFPDRLHVVALAAHRSTHLLARQALEFRPRFVVIADGSKASELEQMLAGSGIRVLAGDEGIMEAAACSDVDIVIAAVTGAAGLHGVLAALRAGKTVALANKETLVTAGALATCMAAEHGGELIPVDSEHSAIFQCLAGEADRTVETILLTASGGPFRTRDARTFASITRAEALCHPNWSMGTKITIDSATMMNKGLEVIEARWLFNVQPSQIEVLVHPQSVVHSMVVFADGSTKAQLGVPDMKVPIQYALSYPDRWKAPHPRVDWRTIGSLDFAPPSLERFPCLRLAFEALRAEGTAPAVLNAANEQAVALFLEDRIRFVDIPAAVERALGMVTGGDATTVEGLMEVDRAARRCVLEHGATITI